MSTDPGQQQRPVGQQRLRRAVLRAVALLAALALLVPVVRQQQAFQAARAAFLHAERTGEVAARSDAVARYEAVVASWPDEPTLRRALANAYLLADRPDDAVVQLEAAWRLQPDSPLTQQQLALAYETTGHTAAADMLWRALGLRADSMDRLAQAHEQANDAATAQAWRERAARQR